MAGLPRLSTQSDDQLIVAWLQDRDRSALEKLVERWRDPACRYAYSILGNYADAEDVVHDVFLHILPKLHTLSRKSSFCGWLFRSVTNSCVSQARSSDRRRARECAFEMAANQDDPVDVPDEMISEVIAGLKHLPNHERLAISLHYIENLSVEEISQSLRQKAVTTRVQLHRGLKRLKATLRRPGEGAPVSSQTIGFSLAALSLPISSYFTSRMDMLVLDMLVLEMPEYVAEAEHSSDEGLIRHRGLLVSTWAAVCLIGILSLVFGLFLLANDGQPAQAIAANACEKDSSVNILYEFTPMVDDFTTAGWVCGVDLGQGKMLRASGHVRTQFDADLQMPTLAWASKPTDRGPAMLSLDQRNIPGQSDGMWTRMSLSKRSRLDETQDFVDPRSNKWILSVDHMEPAVGQGRDDDAHYVRSTHEYDFFDSRLYGRRILGSHGGLAIRSYGSAQLAWAAIVEGTVTDPVSFAKQRLRHLKATASR